jgi:hypothetical protein
MFQVSFNFTSYYSEILRQDFVLEHNGSRLNVSETDLEVLYWLSSNHYVSPGIQRVYSQQEHSQ